jgi:phage gp36-like protein
MNFLTDDDFIQYQVRTEVLNVLKISTSSLDTAEMTAQELMTSYLSTRFDMVATFSATGGDRNPLIIMYMIDIILYDLHSNTAARVLPKLREDRYKAAIQWLEKVNKGDLIPSLTAIPSTAPDPLYKFGSDDRVSSRW